MGRSVARIYLACPPIGRRGPKTRIRLAEVLRVLKPGGVFIGSDSLPSDGLHHFHEDDTYNPIDPAWFLGRLLTVGFERITVSIDGTLTWIAYKPQPEADD